MNLIPCRCGHPQNHHARYEPHTEIDYCVDCGMRNSLEFTRMPVYHNYVGDNLRWLESLVPKNG